MDERSTSLVRTAIQRKRLCRFSSYKFKNPSQGEQSLVKQYRKWLKNQSYVFNFWIDSLTARLLSHFPSYSKLIKKASLIILDNNVKKITHRVKHSIICARSVQINPYEKMFKKGVDSYAKFLFKNTGKNVKRLDLNLMHPNAQECSLRSLSYFIGSQRKLNVLKLNANTNFTANNLNYFQKALNNLKNLSTFSLRSSSQIVSSQELQLRQNLGFALSTSSTLRKFSLRAVVTDDGFQKNILRFLEDLCLSNTLERVDLNFKCHEIIKPDSLSRMIKVLTGLKNHKQLLLKLDLNKDQTIPDRFFERFKKLPNLEILQIKLLGIAIKEQQVQKLFGSISKFSDLQDFQIVSKNQTLTFNQDSCNQFARTLLNNQSRLQHVAVNANRFQLKHIDPIVQTFPSIQRLQSLVINLVVNDTEMSKVEQFAKTIQTQPLLKKIHLGVNFNPNDKSKYQYSVPSEAIEIIANTLCKCQSIERIKLNFGSIYDEALESLSKMINKLKPIDLLALNLAFQQITKNAFLNFCSVLKSNLNKMKEVKVNSSGPSHLNMNLLRNAISLK